MEKGSGRFISFVAEGDSKRLTPVRDASCRSVDRKLVRLVGPEKRMGVWARLLMAFEQWTVHRKMVNIAFEINGGSATGQDRISKSRS
ncbi:hypothetical protein [Ramlibacter sp.]|uniref:hypothetical protein n=1 Tax=Ramlibacter sp. TaxID=1917967 RepID=UPI002FC81914